MNRKLLMAEQKSGNTASRGKGAELAGWDVQWVEPYWAEGLGRARIGLQYRVKNGPDIVAWNRTILSSAVRYKPSVLWVESPQFIFPDTLKSVKQSTGAALVCAYSDDPRDPLKKSRSFDEGKILYDLIFATKDELLQRLLSEGVRFVSKFWKGFDPVRIRPMKLVGDEYKRWEDDLVFIGHIDKVRRTSMRMSILEKVAGSIEKFTIYGKSWATVDENSPLQGNIQPYQVDGVDYSKAISGAKIALQIPSRLARDTHSSRSIEIPACGTLMLAERTVDHQILFEEDKEAIFFSSTEELIDKAIFYLKNDSLRERIAQLGYQRCLNSGYSNYSRMKEMLAILDKATNRRWV